MTGLLDTFLGPTVDRLSQRAAAQASIQLAPIAASATAGVERTINRALIAAAVGIVGIVGALTLGAVIARRGR